MSEDMSKQLLQELGNSELQNIAQHFQMIVQILQKNKSYRISLNSLHKKQKHEFTNMLLLSLAI